MLSKSRTSALHYVTEVALQQHAKLSRLRKSGSGKQTLGVCKETDQRRQEEKELLEDGQRNWNKATNSKGSTGRKIDTRGTGSAHPHPSPTPARLGPRGLALTPLPHPRHASPPPSWYLCPSPTQLARGTASSQLPLSMRPATMTGGPGTVVKRSQDAALEYVRKALKNKKTPLTRLEIDFIRTSFHILGINGETTMRVIVKKAKERGEGQPRRVLASL